MLKYLLLGFLNYRPMFGYHLKQYTDATGQIWHAELSQIYATLKRLEEQGLLTSEIEPQEDRPDRRVYTITQKGREELHRWLARPLTELHVHKEPLLLKLFFSAQLDRETLLTQLRLQYTLRQQQVAQIRDESAAFIRKMVQRNPQLSRDALLWEATRRYGEMFAEMNLRWLEETMAMIEEQL